MRGSLMLLDAISMRVEILFDSKSGGRQIQHMLHDQVHIHFDKNIECIEGGGRS